jgi:hypothetical protein
LDEIGECLEFLPEGDFSSAGSEKEAIRKIFYYLTITGFTPAYGCSLFLFLKFQRDGKPGNYSIT